jgi:hypothetical protein
MNELFQQWLDGRLSVPGMIACGVASATAAAGDAAGACWSKDANFPAEKMGEILALLQNTAQVPGAAPAVVRSHTWVFANGKIRYVVRPDGWVFAIAVHANSDAAQVLDPLTEEFLALHPGA